MSFVGNGFTAIGIYRAVNVSIHDCEFISNSGIIGGAIDVTNSILFFNGDNLFFNNTGRNGGAIHLSNSTIKMKPNSTIIFKENKAKEIGGALFNEPGCGQGSCFYSLAFDLENPFQSIPVSIVFNNNTALTGSDIYGAGLQNDCQVSKNTKSCDIQSSVFTFLNRSKTAVTSGPKRVCLCKNGTINCADIDYIFHNLSVAAGEKFILDAVLVGDDFDTTIGGVYASSVSKEPSFSFGASRKLQLSEVTEHCTQLEYSIEPNHDAVKKVTFLLSTIELLPERINYNSTIKNKMFKIISTKVL